LRAAQCGDWLTDRREKFLPPKNPAWMEICPNFAEKLLNYPGRAELFFNHYDQINLFEKAKTLLSVGAGRGDIELVILNRTKLSLGILEPSEHMLSQFRVLAKPFEDRLREVIQSGFETAKVSNQYDVILSVYSWANLGFSVDALQKALNILNPQGVLAISMGSEVDPMTDAYKLLIPNRPDNMTVEEFMGWATKQGFVFDVHNFVRSAPANLLFVDNGLTPACKALFSYWAGIHWDQIPNQTKKGIENVIVSQCVDKAITFHGKTLLFRKNAARDF
jgi:SAM-dependent methyltransferase